MRIKNLRGVSEVRFLKTRLLHLGNVEKPSHPQFFAQRVPEACMRVKKKFENMFFRKFIKKFPIKAVFGNFSNRCTSSVAAYLPSTSKINFDPKNNWKKNSENCFWGKWVGMEVLGFLVSVLVPKTMVHI